MPDMNFSELNVFNVLMQHADAIANTPTLNNAAMQQQLFQLQSQITTIQSQMNADSQAQAVDRMRMSNDATADGTRKEDARRRAMRSIAQYIRS